MTYTLEHTGAEASLDRFYATRAAAVLAYCSRLCLPERVSVACDAAFARVDAKAVDRDAALRSAARTAAVENAAQAASFYPCADVPRLLAASAAGETHADESARLEEHLRSCRACRAWRDRFDAAERVLSALLPVRGAVTAPGREGAPPANGAVPGEPGEAGGPPSARASAHPRPLPPNGAPAAPVDTARGAHPAPARGVSAGPVDMAWGNVTTPAPSRGADITRLRSNGAASLRPPPVVRTPPAARPRRAPPRQRAGAPVASLPRRVERPAAPQPAPRRRPRLGRAARRHLSSLLLVVGLLMIAEAITTVAWKEPFTSYLASRAQAALRGELASLERGSGRIDSAQQRTLATIADARARTDADIRMFAARLAASARPGSALGWIQVPRIGIDYVFVQGTGAASLRKGPAHYTQTPLPGEPGTVGVAGHRTTYLAPFRDIDALRRGDRIVVRMPYGRFVYNVDGRRIVPASATDAFRPVGYDRIVLSACHPLYSASHRILVSARLVSRMPLGAAVGAARGAQPTQVDAQLRALGVRQLEHGMTGADVRELQRLLGVPPTGYFGYETHAAVIAFQHQHGLASTGIVDDALKRALARRPGPPLRPPTPPPVAP